MKVKRGETVRLPAPERSKFTVWRAVELLMICKEAKAGTNAHDRDRAFQLVIDALTEELERILKP